MSNSSFIPGFDDLSDAEKLQLLDSILSTKPAAEPENTQGIVGDAVDMAQRGALQGVGGLFSLAKEFTGYGQGGADYFNKWAGEQLDTISPESREAMGKEIFTTGGDGRVEFGEGITDPRALLMAGAQGVGTLAPTMAVGGGAGLLAKGAGLGATGVSVASQVGFAGTGGGMAQGMAGQDARATVMAVPDETLYQSKAFLDLWNSDFYDENLDAAANATRAREYLADAAASEVMRDPELAAVNFGSNLVTGKVFDGLLKGTLGKSRLGNAAIAGVSEASEEFAQEGLSALKVNEAARKIDPSISDDNVLPQALTGALVGFGIGAPLGLAGRVDSAREEAAKAGADPLEQELAASNAAAQGGAELIARKAELDSLNQHAVDATYGEVQQQGAQRTAGITPGENLDALNEGRKKRLSGIDGDILILERSGDTEGATILRNATNLYRRAQQLEAAGKTGMANKLNLRADEIVSSFYGQAEPEPGTGNSLPAESVSNGQFMPADTGMPVATDTKQASVIDGEVEREPLSLEQSNYKLPNKPREGEYIPGESLPVPSSGREGDTYNIDPLQINKSDTIFADASPEEAARLAAERAERERKTGANTDAYEGQFSPGDGGNTTVRGKQNTTAPEATNENDVASNDVTLAGEKPVLQNRDRSTPESIAQMRSIASNPDYSRLSFSRDLSAGAPVVEAGADIPRQNLGRKDVAASSSGRKIPIQYAVVEADQLLSSNDINGSPVKGYDAGVNGKSRAIAGNGRVTGLQHAHSSGQGGNYKQEMAEDNTHGIDPGVIRRMKNPVLVRVMPSSEITNDIGDESNISGVSELSPVEQARNDARRINVAGTAVIGPDGQLTREAAEQFINSMPESERGGLRDGKLPSKRAYERMENAIFAAAFDNDELIRLQAQATDPEARTVMSGLVAAAGPLSRLKGKGNYDVRAIVAEAAAIAVNARRQGRSLQEFIQQTDMAVSPESSPILQMFSENIRSAKAIGDKLTLLADALYNESTKPDEDMFGAVEKRAPATLTDEAFNNEQQFNAQGAGNQGGANASDGTDERNANGKSTGTSEGRTKSTETTKPTKDFTLNQYTEQELAEQAKAQADADAAAKSAEAAATAKVDADNDLANFNLAGSNAPGDIASSRGQDSLFDAPKNQAKSLRGDNLNGEWRAFAPTSGSKNIPRSAMPQVKAEHRGALANFLKARGISGTEETVAASELKPTQAEFSEAKVQKAKEFTGGDRAILVSQDGHVVDGHHQWLAKHDNNEDVRVIRLGAPIEELLEQVKEFPSADVDLSAEGSRANQEPKAPNTEAQQGNDESAQAVDQENAGDGISKDDLDADTIISAYAHSSRSPNGMVKIEQESYVNFIDGVRADLIEDLPEGKQGALDAGLRDLANEYIRRRKLVLKARSGVVSSMIAGKSNFNAKQAARRGSLLDKSESVFDAWTKQAASDLADYLGVSAIRKERAAQKALKQVEARKSADEKLKAEKKAESKRRIKLPIVNEPSADVAMTKDEWAKTPKDYKSILATDAYRYRSVMRLGGMKSVYISDQPDIPVPSSKASPDSSTKGVLPEVSEDGYTVDYHKDVFRTITDQGDAVPVNEVKAAFEGMVSSPDAVKKALNKLTIKQLTPIARPNFSGEKKAALVDMAFKKMIADYEWLTVREAFMTSTGGYDLDSKIEGARKRLAELTANDLRQFSEDRKAAVEERKAQITALNKSLKNPETLEEFESFISYKGRDKLSPDQLRQYDALKAGKTIEEMEAEKAAKAVKSGLEIDDELDINPIEEGVHGKTGEPIFNVSLKTRLGKDKFKEAAGMARSMAGGYWKGNFYFKSREDAELFTGWLQGEEVDNSAKVEQRDADKQDRRVTKLRDLASQLEEKGDSKLSADRKTNTARRALMAASAEEQAAKQIEFARSLRLIADAVERGEAPFLANISATTQLSELRSIQKQAIPKELRNDPNFDGYSISGGELKPGVTIDDYAHHIEYPSYTLYGEIIADLGKDIASVPGLKRIGERLQKVGLSDPRQQMTISADDVAAIKAKVGVNHIDKYGRRGKLVMPWQLERKVEQVGRLERMGITTGEHLRAAIRELDAIEQSVEKIKQDPLKAKERELVGKKIPGFFPTPDAVVQRLLDEAGIEPGMRVLEPSAGKGDIADAIKEAAPDAELDVVEYNSTLRGLLEAKGYSVAGQDFLEHSGSYDRIVMNPPFEKNADIEHVRHAYSMLKPGGRLVAVMSGSAGFRQDKVNREFKEWINELGGVMEPLPEGSFKSSFRPTGVNTQMVVLEKGEILYSRAVTKSGATPKGVGLGSAKIAIHKFLKHYKGANDVTVKVFRTHEEAHGTPAPFRTKGGYDPKTDTLFIYTDALDSIADLDETLRHEILVHKGLGMVEPAQLKQLLSALAQAAKDSPRLQGYLDEVEGVEAGRSDALKAEELLARIAQERLSLPDRVWNRIVLALQRVMASLGLGKVDAYRQGRDYVYRIGDAFAQGRRAPRRDSDEIFNDAGGAPADTREAAFKRWFGKSKVVDDNGDPIVMYHGTPGDFSSFEKGEVNSRYPYSIGFHFSTNPKEASAYTREGVNVREYRTIEGSNVMPVYLKAENPLIIKTKHKSASMEADLNRKEIKATLAEAESSGNPYDSVIIKAANNDHWNVIVFEPGQIKSATGNNGDFDPSNPDILYSRTAEVDPARASVLEKIGLAQDTRTPLQKMREGISEWWSELFSNFIPAVADKFHDLKKINAEAYMRARMSTNTGAALAAALGHATPEWHENGLLKAKRGSKGLLEILKRVDGESNEWIGWMVGKRAQNLMDQGRENLLTEEDIAALLDVTPEQAQRFQQTADEWQAYNGAMLDIMAGGGLITQEDADHFKQDPYYIPFYRESLDDTGEIDIAAPFTKKGLSHQKDGIEALKGGTANLQDPLKNMLMNVSRAIDASVKNNALRRIIDEVSPGADNPILTPALEGNRSGPSVIRVRRDGENEWYRVHDLGVLGALTAMNDIQTSALTRALGIPKRLLTAGVTATPTFMLRNAVRDITASWVQSEDVKWQASKALGQFRDALKIDDDTLDMMMAGSAFMGGYRYSNDATSNADALREQLRAKGMSTGDIDGYISSIWDGSKAKWEWYREKGERFENMARLKMFKDSLASGDNYFEAAYKSKDLMDFSLHGRNSIMHFLIQTVPFMNARIQGLYKLGRVGGNAKNNAELAKLLAIKGGTLAAMSLALLALNDDEERYQELPDWDKDANWHLFFENEHIRIPKPFELGLMFGTLPERAARLASGDDDARVFFKSMSTNVLSTLSMNPVPQALMPIGEAAFNYDLFRGRTIDNMSDLGNLPGSRKSNYTSEIAKGMGGIFESMGITGDMASPKRIDHIIKGYTGSMGISFLSAIDGIVHMASGNTMPAMNQRDYPVLGWFARGNDPVGTKYSDDFYRLMERANQAYSTARDPNTDSERRQEILEDYAPELRARKLLSKTSKALSNLRKQRDLIYRDNSLTAEQKRDRLNRIQELTNTLQKRAVDIAEE